jgi:hypothetical protein
MPSKTIDQWTKSHHYSRGFYYLLKKRNKAPRTFKAGATRRISDEADAEWVRAREAESAGTTPSPDAAHEADAATATSA